MPNVNNGAHRPELDNMTPAMIRVLCEELLYTMDYEQRRKIATKLPGIYKMVFGSIPETMVETKAHEIAGFLNRNESEPTRKVSDEDVFAALKQVGL